MSQDWNPTTHMTWQTSTASYISPKMKGCVQWSLNLMCFDGPIFVFPLLKTHAYWWTQKFHVFWWTVIPPPKTSFVLMDPLPHVFWWTLWAVKSHECRHLGQIETEISMGNHRQPSTFTGLPKWDLEQFLVSNRYIQEQRTFILPLVLK